MAGDLDLSQYMAIVAERLLGPPNARLSNKTVLRYGTHGSLSVDVDKGTWFDHEQGQGGGVLDLVGRETGLKANGPAVAWLRKERILPEDDDGPASRGHDRDPPARARIAATYDYVDESGELVFQVVRMEPKTFRQRRRATDADDPSKVRDGWVWSVKGIPQVPYKLPELLEAIAMERTVYIAEGEKDVENLWKLGLPATTNAMGAGKWPASLREFFAGADVVLLPDNDQAGRDHVALVGAGLEGIAQRVRVLDLPDLPDKGDVSDWIAAGGTLDALQQLVERSARPFGEKPVTLHFEAVWFGQASKAPPTDWLVDDMLTRGDRSLVYGESQSGKSFLATHIAMGVARGTPIFEHKVLRPGGVVYIAAEGQKGYGNRLTAYRAHFALAGDAPQVPFVYLPVAMNLFTDEEGSDIERLLADLEVIAGKMRDLGVSLDLVVIDTHSAVSTGADENASKDVSRLINHYKQIQEGTGAHVMIVHHKNAGGERPRGHTSIYADIDNAIEVTCDEQKERAAIIRKVRDGENGEKIGFRLQSVTIGARDDGKPITSCVVVPAGAQAQTGKGLFLSDQQRIALTALREALIDNGEPAPGALKLPFGVRAVRIEHWKREFLKRGFVDEPNPATFRSAFKRVWDALQSKNVIGVNAPYVWIAREPSANPGGHRRLGNATPATDATPDATGAPLPFDATQS